MKKIILLLLLTTSSIMIINAQSYTINKLNYDSRFYTPAYGDPYDPVICGVASFVVPGLGQMIAGETGRGLAFLGGAITSVILYGGGGAYFLTLASYGEFHTGSFALMMLGMSGIAIVDIWSIIDAVNVAKVNNMYIQDIRKRNGESSIESIQLTPYIDRLAINNQVVTPVGLKLSVTF